MDPRQALSRTTSSNIPQQQAPYQPNMASAYQMPYHNTHLPPIQGYHQPAGQNYMPQQQYRPELSRYSSAPAPTGTPDRYNSHVPPQNQMGGLPPTSMLPQPGNQGQQQPQNYPPPSSQSQPYQQRLAPAPPRPNNMTPLGTNYPQGEDRPPMWSNAEAAPGIPADNGRDPTRTHVVGSQGRRGILPSAPGRAAVMPNAMNGSPKTNNAVPAKDADGKFPCPNCNKTYLHAKHLKRHMLRHTGDRPYMCVLCNDTFSRSDILKRHFQKCSVRRGNPTGASHLSNPAAHLKKSQAAAAKSTTDSPNSTTTPTTGGLPNGAFTSTAMSAGPMTSTSAPSYADGQQMPYGMNNGPPGDMQRPQQGQPLQGSGAQNTNPNWAMQNPRNSQLMYHSTPASPDHFGMQHGNVDDKRHVMPGAPPHMDGDWNHMFQQGGNENYMNPMFAGYDQGHHGVKKEYEQPEGGENGYYMPSTSLGTDGTLRTPLWNLDAYEEDPLQLKADKLVNFCFPRGIQDSLQEQQNSFHVRACLTPESIKHCLQLFHHWNGHWPFIHTSTFSVLEAYDGVILAMVCIGGVYSDNIAPRHLKDLMMRTKTGIERTARILQQTELADLPGNDFDELQALLMLQTLFIWHGTPQERSLAREESKRIFDLAQRYGILELAGPAMLESYSYLHHLAPGEDADARKWDWRVWVEQEKRSRLMFLIFLLDAALTTYFNCQPTFDPAKIRLPLPCDDAAWEAPDSESCAQALGMRGLEAQKPVNSSGSLRLKQIDMNFAMSLLQDHSAVIEPNSTNVYSKFILIHGIHIMIWHVQRRRSHEISSYQGPAQPTPPETNRLLQSCLTALDRWKQNWDEDMLLQYGLRRTPRRIGFCRDGIHFFFLGRALLQQNRIHDWQLSPDQRFNQAISGLKKAREWSRSDGAQRGEQPGSVFDIDDRYGREGIEISMRDLFRPLEDQ